MSIQLRRFWLLLLTSIVVLVVIRVTMEALIDAELPWLVIAALTAMAGLVLHKRLIYRPVFGKRRVLAFVCVTLIYFLPAVICWTAIVILITRNMLPSLGGIWAQFLVFIGVAGLVQLLMQQELVELRQK
jgi:hypothetical protein